MVVDWFILTTVAERSIRGTFFFFFLGFLSFFLSFFNEPQLLLCPSFKIHEAVGHNSRHCACSQFAGFFLSPSTRYCYGAWRLQGIYGGDGRRVAGH